MDIQRDRIDNWQTGHSWSDANKESCQRGFSWAPQEAGQNYLRWRLLSLADTQAGRAGEGVVALEVEPALWWSISWHQQHHQQQTGLSRGRERDHTHSATLLLRSKQRLTGRATPEKLLLSGDGFHVNGSLNRRCVTALAAHWAPSDPGLLGF